MGGATVLTQVIAETTVGTPRSRIRNSLFLQRVLFPCESNVFRQVTEPAV